MHLSKLHPDASTFPAPHLQGWGLHLKCSPPLNLPARVPIAHRTRSRAPAPAPLALFTAGRLLHKCITYQMPTAKAIRSPAEPIGFAGLCRAMPAAEVSGFAGLCQALSQLDMPEALSVLDTSTGEFLELRALTPSFSLTITIFPPTKERKSATPW